MTGQDALVNKGVTLLEPAEQSSNASTQNSRRIVIIGTARGGTSLISGALHHLGVYMGEKSRPPVFEDVILASDIEAGNTEAAKKTIQQYNEHHDVWAFKRPHLIDHLNLTHEIFDNPQYIFIYKDAFSISNRNVISMKSDILSGMGKALSQYQKTITFLQETQPRAMLVSYDKAMRYPQNFIDELIDFCGISPEKEERDAASAFIDPEPGNYLDRSRITKTQGHLGGFKNRTIRGWARYVHQPKKDAQVCIMLNDTHIATVTADQSRQDLDEKFGKSCAFVYQLPEDQQIQAGDILRARVQDDVFDLNKSPLTVK